MPAFSSIAAGVGAVGALAGGIGSMFGGGGDDSSMADAAIQAAQIQAEATRQASQQRWDMYQQGRSDVAPWLKLGQNTTGVLGGLFNIPGYEAVDPTATLKATPGYGWMQDQGLEGLSRYAAAKGLTYSGPQMKSVADWSQNLAINKAWNPYINQLNTMSGQGLTAGTQSGNWAVGTGTGMAGDTLAAGQAQGQGIWNQAIANQASNQRNQNVWSSLFGMGFQGAGGFPAISQGINGLGRLFNTNSSGAPSYTSSGYYPGGYGYQDYYR